MSTHPPPARPPVSAGEAPSPWSSGLSLWIPPEELVDTKQPAMLPAGREPSRPRFRVLLADDDKCIVEVTSLILSFSGYDVVVAEDGEQAWRAYLEKGCDLVLTDQDMPCLTGTELIERIRSNGDPVPVVLTSGRTAASQLPPLLRDQIDAVLPKPFAADTLLETIRGFLRRESP